MEATEHKNQGCGMNKGNCRKNMYNLLRRPSAKVNYRSRRVCKSSLLQIAMRHTRELTADDKYRLLTTVQDDIRNDELDTRSFPAGDPKGKKRKVKQITFQRSWLREDNWLRYGKSRNDKGGYCLPCILHELLQMA